MTRRGTRRVVIVDVYPHMHGGAQRVAQALARDLPAHGWTTEVLTTGDGPVVDAIRGDGTTCTILPPPRQLLNYGRTTFAGARQLGAALALPWYWLSVFRFLRRQRAEIVHIDDHRGMVLFAPAARLARARVVWHLHSVQRSRALNFACSVLAHAIVVPTHAVLAHMPGLWSRRTPVVIPNGIAIGPEPPSATAGTDEHNATVVTLARLHPDKGVDVLLRAIAIVRQRHPDVRLVVLGSVQLGVEGHADELRRLTTELGLDGAVDFAGQVDDPRPQLEAAAVYAQPARDRTEVLPLAVLEAMERGRPVVATDVGGMRDMVVDGETGLLVPQEDPPALAAAIGRLLADRALAARLGHAGRERVINRFSDQTVSARVSALYEG